MPECPMCGEAFESRRGLGVHHSQAHDKLLPNRECARCGTEFHSKHVKKYCSTLCRAAAVSFEGETNPNYDGGKERSTCELCGTEFGYYPSEKPGHFCPSCVESEQWRHERDITAERNPRWSGGKRTYECDHCGARFKRWQGQVESDRVFCSDECQSAWISESFTGEGHPNWEGGTNANYGQGWYRARRQVLERDGHTCVRCGVTCGELGRNPDVHHIIPVGEFLETPVTCEADAHYPANLVSLCPPCHRRVEYADPDRDLLRKFA